ncbi:LOW QUALITY PROTEIN: membrane protein, partial [Streptomyces sp. e14]
EQALGRGRPRKWQGGRRDEGRRSAAGESHQHVETLRETMTAHSATAAPPRVRTGGPQDDDGPKILEHVLGWTLVVVIAMLVTQLGLL